VLLVVEMNSEQLVEMWLDSVSYSHSNSPCTRRNYGRIFQQFCKDTQTDAQKILADYEQSEANQMSERTLKRKHSQNIQLWVNQLRKKGFAVGTINSYLYTIISFFHYNDCSLGNISIPQFAVTYHNRDITRTEINQILSIVGLQCRAICGVIAQSGLRPSTVLKLKIKDVEKILDSDTPIPCKIWVSKEIEKGKLHDGHVSFIAEDSIKYIKQYLSTRQNITQESNLFEETYEQVVSRQFRTKLRKLSTTGAVTYENRVGKPSEIRLYNLRKYFRKMANQMGFEHVNYLMNHSTNSSDGHYVPKDSEFYRELYTSKVLPFIRLERQTPTESQQVITALREQYKKDLEVLTTDVKADLLKQIADLREQFDKLVSEKMSKDIDLEMKRN
jgi:integrase